jgi:hypothetical protein
LRDLESFMNFDSIRCNPSSQSPNNSTGRAAANVPLRYGRRLWPRSKRFKRNRSN